MNWGTQPQQSNYEIPQHIALPNPGSNFGSGGLSGISWNDVQSAQMAQNQYADMNNWGTPNLTNPQGQGGFMGKLFGSGTQEGGNMFGSMGPNGWQPSGLSQGLGLAKDLFGAWGGMQDRKLAKKQFNFTKEAFNKQYDAQKRLTNSQLRDRQQRRQAEGTARTGTDEYMKQNGVQ